MAAPDGGRSDVYDVIVVGGGVMGSAVAYRCARRGLRVLALEQHEWLHERGSSHGESRIVRRTYADLRYAELMRHAFALWAEAEAEAGEALLTRTGGIDIGARDSVSIRQLLEACVACGVEVQVLDPAEAGARFGVRLAEGEVAVYSAETSVAAATKTCAAFQRLARQHGAELLDGARVAAVHAARAAPAGEGASSDGDWCVRVRLADGRAFTGRRAVVCPGGWAGALVRLISGLDLPLCVWQCTTAYYAPAASDGGAPTPAAAGPAATLPILIHYAAGHGDAAAAGEDRPAAASSLAPPPTHVYSCPSSSRPGCHKFGLHAGVVTTAEGRSGIPDDALTLAPVRAYLRERLPCLHPAPVEGSVQTCLYTLTPDEDFILDHLPLRAEADPAGGGEGEGEGARAAAGGAGALAAAPSCLPSSPSADLCLLLAGFSGHGFKFSPWIGELAATVAAPGGSLAAAEERFGSLAKFALGRAALRAPTPAAGPDGVS